MEFTTEEIEKSLSNSIEVNPYFAVENVFLVGEVAKEAENPEKITIAIFMRDKSTMNQDELAEVLGHGVQVSTDEKVAIKSEDGEQIVLDLEASFNPNANYAESNRVDISNDVVSKDTTDTY